MKFRRQNDEKISQLNFNYQISYNVDTAMNFIYFSTNIGKHFSTTFSVEID